MPALDRLKSAVRQDPWILTLIVLIPILIFVEFKVVGRLFGSELLIVAAVPFLLWARGKELLEPVLLAILALGVGWCMSQVLSDLYLGSAFTDFSRGWAKIIVFIVNLAILYLILGKNLTYWKIFAIVLLMGQVADVAFSPTANEAQVPWKFGYGFYLTLVAAIIAQSFYQRGWVIVSMGLLVAMGGANFVMGSRSVAIMCFLAVATVASHRVAVWFSTRRKIGPAKPSLLLAGAVVAVAIMGALQVYGALASNDYLGPRAKEKHLSQSGGQFGILLGGRKEILVSSVAIADSPLIGHGSWANDPKYSALLIERAAELGYRVSTTRERLTIPSHSYLFSSWVNAGLVGAVFWAWILVFTIVTVATAYRYSHPQLLLVTFVGASLSWDILFSPFGGEDRLVAAMSIVLLIYAWNSAQEYRE